MKQTIRVLGVAVVAALAGACGDSPGSGVVDTGIDAGDDGSGSDTGDVGDDAAPDAADAVDAVDTVDATDGSGDAADGSGEEPDTTPSDVCGPDHCEIDDVCYANGDANPDNPCEACSPLVAVNLWTPNDAATCDDGSLCTADDACFEGACVGVATDCDDGNECTADLCDPETGLCASENVDGATCSDGDVCTLGDVCAAGACQSGGEALPCDDGNPCTAESCDPERGCVSEPVDGGACDDEDPCTVGDVCSAGRCEAGPAPLDCGDEDLCTIDRCEPGIGCTYRSIADLCTDDNPCTDETCDPEQGCVFPFNTDPCNDDSACTAGDACVEGACRGVPIDLGDANVCTDDLCDETTGPYTVNNTDLCDDFDACTVGDTCATGDCEPGLEPLDCDDINACTDDTCDPVDGCLNLPNTDPCDDDNLCTEFDTCGSGECIGTRVNCDDGNACTADSCGASTGCVHTLIVTDSCRPTIDVTWPPRAWTVEDTGAQVITVTGTVSSGAGPITSLSLNGEAVTLTPSAADPAVFEFAHPIATQFGSNRLTFEAVDSFDSVRRRVQAFHWSRDYALATPVEDSGMVDPGLGLWLSQTTIDDGVAPPPTDLAAIFQQVIAGIDLTSFFSTSEVLASSAGYNIYLRSLALGGSSVSLAAIDGGLRINAALRNINGRLFFDCTNFGCQLLGGDGGGSLSVSSVAIAANLLISVRPDNTLQVTVASPTTSISGVNISADNGWTNFLLSIVEGAILGGLVSDLENELNTQLATAIGPLLEDALSALAFNLAFDLPRLDDATQTIPVALASDFSQSDFRDASPGPQGGLLALRARSYTTVRGVPDGDPFDANLGTPLRLNCGSGTQSLSMPLATGIEFAFPDDTLNEILRAAWWGGLFEFDVGPSLLGDIDLSTYGVVINDMHISGLLPPAAGDCEGGPLTLKAGDLAVTADLTVLGTQLNLIVYLAFDAPIRLDVVDGQVSIIIDELANVDMEVNVVQDDLIGFESVIEDLLRTQLVPAIGGLLGSGEPLAGFPLPEIDLSSSLGLPAGTTVIAIVPSGVVRSGGNSIIQGALR